MRRHRSSVAVHEILHTCVQTICFGAEHTKRTSEFPRVPRQNLVDKCPLIHLNRFIVSRVPLHINLLERSRLEDGLHVPVHLSLSSPLKNGGRVWAVMIVALIVFICNTRGALLRINGRVSSDAPLNVQNISPSFWSFPKPQHRSRFPPTWGFDESLHSAQITEGPMV